MTQIDLAAGLRYGEVDIDRAGVAKIEGGYRQASDVELVLIAMVLGVSVADLLPSPMGND